MTESGHGHFSRGGGSELSIGAGVVKERAKVASVVGLALETDAAGEDAGGRLTDGAVAEVAVVKGDRIGGKRGLVEGADGFLNVVSPRSSGRRTGRHSVASSVIEDDVVAVVVWDTVGRGLGRHDIGRTRKILSLRGRTGKRMV